MTKSEWPSPEEFNQVDAEEAIREFGLSETAVVRSLARIKQGIMTTIEKGEVDFRLRRGELMQDQELVNAAIAATSSWGEGRLVLTNRYFEKAASRGLTADEAHNLLPYLVRNEIPFYEK